jgi:hypothetical protein
VTIEQAVNERRTDAAERAGHYRARTVIGLTAVSGIPLAVALAVLYHPRLYPVLDIAQTELLVRDVGTAHPPVVGLSSRLNAFGVRGSHPGPISFWALWPFYGLFGASSWSLQAASASLHLLAIGTAVWIGHRRGGLAGALGVAVVLVLLAKAYGADRLVDGWVANLPVLWWVVFLLAVWSLVCGDVPMLPVALLAGSFAMQTHISYLGLVPGIGAVALGVVAWRALRPPREPTAWRRVAVFAVPSGVLLGVLWIPTLVDQLVHAPGNLSIIRESFANPADAQAGVGWGAVELWLAHLNPWRLLTNIEDHAQSRAFTGPWFAGAVTLAVWAGAAVSAVRDRRRDLVALHLVVGLALVLGLVSICQIYGPVWSYLLLWSWGTTTLLVLATAWTIVPAVARRLPAGWRERGPLALAGAGLVVVAAFTYDAAHADGLDSSIAETDGLGAVLADTAPALRSGDIPGTGPDGRYLLRWDESSVGSGAMGVEMLLQLEHRGFDIGAPAHHGAEVGRGRVRTVEEATATIDYVVGTEAISRWRSRPDAVEVAHTDPRTEADIARYDRRHAEVAARLRDAGLDDLAATLDRNLLAVAWDERLPRSLADDLDTLADLGHPEAVFVTPT